MIEKSGGGVIVVDEGGEKVDDCEKWRGSEDSAKGRRVGGI